MSEETKEEQAAPSEDEVLAHLAVVVHRVAKRVAEQTPEEMREAALAAAEEVLLDDEGARELLGAAFEEGRKDALATALREGAGEQIAPDWSDVESLGERKAIVREESACGSCSVSDVCAVARAARTIEALIVIRRCDRHR